jgi:hypothetical protein
MKVALDYLARGQRQRASWDSDSAPTGRLSGRTPTLPLGRPLAKTGERPSKTSLSAAEREDVTGLHKDDIWFYIGFVKRRRPQVCGRPRERRNASTVSKRAGFSS